MGELGAFQITFLIVGITQVVKKLVPNLTENGKIVVALVVGVVFLSTAQVLPYLSETAATVVLAVVNVLGNSMAIPGLFSVVKDDLLNR